MLASFTLTCQWVRELRRWHAGVLVAVQVRLPDDQPVTVRRYGTRPAVVTAARAVAIVRDLDDPRGYEMFVPALSPRSHEGVVPCQRTRTDAERAATVSVFTEILAGWWAKHANAGQTKP